MTETVLITGANALVAKHLVSMSEVKIKTKSKKHIV